MFQLVLFGDMRMGHIKYVESSNAVFRHLWTNLTQREIFTSILQLYQPFCNLFSHRILWSPWLCRKSGLFSFFYFFAIFVLFEAFYIFYFWANLVLHSEFHSHWLIWLWLYKESKQFPEPKLCLEEFRKAAVFPENNLFYLWCSCRNKSVF